MTTTNQLRTLHNIAKAHDFEAIIIGDSLAVYIPDSTGAQERFIVNTREQLLDTLGY